MLMFEYILVALIVIACSVFSTWRLLSARMRLRLLDALSTLTGKAGDGVERTDSGWLSHLRRKTVAQLGSGCNSCGVSGHRKPYAAAQPGRDLSAAFPPVNRSSAAPHR